MRFLRRYFLVFVVTMLTTIALNAQWVRTNGPHTERTLSLAIGINDKGDTTLYAGTFNGMVFLSTDYGDNWIKIAYDTSFSSNNPGFSSKDVSALATSPNLTGGISVFAGTEGDGVFLSLNSDTNWVAVNNGLTNLFINSFLCIPQKNGGINIFVGTLGGVFLSTNNGTSWENLNNGLMNATVEALAVLKDENGIDNLFACSGYPGGVFRSTDNGINWVTFENELSSSSIKDIVASDSNLFVLTYDNDVFRSTNKGVSWDIINDVCPSYEEVVCLAAHDTIVYAGVAYGGSSLVYYSVNGGNSWGNGKEGGIASIECMKIGGPFLFVGTSSAWDFGGSVWRRPLSEMLTDFTDVKDNEKQSPHDFILEQNYPNPFNPTTTISFSLPSRSFVSLKVFDGLGREVTVLLSEELAAGNYTQQWNASGFSNGVYYYRLQAGTYFQTKKLVLLK